MFEQFDDGLMLAVAIGGIVVEVAGDDEARIGGQAPAAALIVAQPRRVAGRQVLAPQPDLVRIAQSVAVLRAIEHRRRGM